jgi:hypothetical protein
MTAQGVVGHPDRPARRRGQPRFQTPNNRGSGSAALGRLGTSTAANDDLHIIQAAVRRVGDDA